MHNNTPIVPYVSLCSGYEGIGLGLHRCIPNLRCIAYCEREAFAIANLVAKMENGLLDAAPVFTDVTTFPWEQFAPYMAGGILSFGWPCQPVSCAGKRKATEDERWLFDIIADGIAIMRPGILFAENVEGLLSAKMPNGSLVFAHCIERLESLHYKVSWGIFSASEVGAPHQRKRVFIMAYSTSIGGRENNWTGNSGLPHQANEVWPSRPGEPQHAWEPPRVVDSASSRQQAQRQKPNHEWRSRFVGKPSKLGDTEHARSRNEKSEQDCWEQNTDGRGNPHEGARASRTGESVGNALLAGSSSEWSIRGQQDGLGEPSAEAMGNTAEQGCEGGRGSNGSLGESRRFAKPSRSCANGPMESGQRQAQPPLGLHSNESSGFLGQALTLNPYGDNVYPYENISKKIRAREVLFSVWREAISKEIQWTAGGLQCFLAEKILQSGMQLDSFTQRICYFVWCIQTSHEAQGWGLHGMWVYENCRNSSRGQKPIEQFKRELGYAMCQLSYEIALEGRKDAVEAESILQGVREASERAWALSQALPEMEEVWRSSLDQKVWEKGCYIEATSIGNRTDELRLLGNGVVPATAERAFRTLMEELFNNK